MRKTLIILFSLFVACIGQENNRKNILHIMVDDLRPELNIYNPQGHRIYTPNIDILGNNGLIFDRAYANQALCNPSRSSYMTGRRPDETKVWNLDTSFRDIHPTWTSLPGMFKDAGFITMGVGKTYHPKCPPRYDSTLSWSKESLPYQNPCWIYGVDCIPCPKTLWNIGNVSEDWCEIESYSDSLTVDAGIKLLEKMSKKKDNFYLAVGLHKPHLPWQAKKKHYDLYPLENITLAKYKTIPKNTPEIAWVDTDSPNPWEPISDDLAKVARRGYYASTTGMDENVGKLLKALDNLNLSNSTAIIFHSDHGWQLGEHGEWRKFTNFEMSLKVPLIVKVPWIKNTHGKRTESIVELVDIMPTLADIVNISKPNDPGSPLSGESFLPIIKNEKVSVKDEAYGQYPRRVKNGKKDWENNNIVHVDPTNFTHMGYTVRVKDWRYTEWYLWNGTQMQVMWDKLVAQELYDHRGEETTKNDFDLYENENVYNSSSNKKIITNLSNKIYKKYGCKN